MDQLRPAPRQSSLPTCLLELILLATAVVGRLPALGSWWTLDDWGQLGRAAHVAPAVHGWPARILSQHWWWQGNWALWGLDPVPQAAARMLLHAGAVILVGRIGRRAGLPTGAWFTGALVFAASPLAFTPLYWASGIQELLAVFFALLAVERWLDGTRRAMTMALAAAILSFLAKESGFGLPLFFLAVLWWGETIKPEDRSFAWALIMLMLAAVVTAGTLVMAHFATGPDDPYALGGVGVMIANLTTFGWWLLSPGPLLASQVTWQMGVAGAAFFLLWGLWSGFSLPKGEALPAAGLLATLLILAPALPLRSQIHPYLAYLAVAPLALTLVSLVPRTWWRYRWLPLLALPVMAWSLVGMEVRLDNRNEMGFPADPVVRATSLSWAATNLIRSVTAHTALAGADSSGALILYQQPLGKADLADAEKFGPGWVHASELYKACGGLVGPTLVSPAGTRVVWRNALTGDATSAQVLAESGTGFKVWGPVPNALLYAALTDVALGNYERTRRHLLAAAALNPSTINFVYDEGQMIVPLQLALKNLQPFIDWTVARLDRGSSQYEIGGIQTMFFDLMSRCTGKSVAELTAGSRILIPGQDSSAPTAKDEH